MKYSVWEVSETFEPIRCVVSELAVNKKSMKGKWQIFLKNYLPNGKKVGFHAFYPDNHIIAVFDERMEMIRNRIKWTK